MNSRDYAASVKAVAAGQWPEILQQLAGLDEAQTDTRKRHSGNPCPVCGGGDRYSFKSPENGWWACRHCGGGDGFTLLMNVHNWSFMEAVAKVGALLGLEGRSEVELSKIRKDSEDRRQQRQQERKVKESQRKACGITDARRLWASAGPYREHPYAIQKLFSQRLLGLCRQHGSWLLVPLYAGGELVNVQRFAWRKPEGARRLPRYFVEGAPLKGAYLAYGPDSFTVMITEGVADADACFQLEHMACRVVCAFCASQLPAAAAEWVRLKMPESQIILCPDNDEAGIRYATEAARAVHGCLMATPPPPDNDWSDHFLSQSSEVAS